MTHQNFDQNDFLSVICGFATTALTEIGYFGGEAIKAFVLGIIGGGAAYLGKHLIEKYFIKKKKHNAGK